MKLSKAKLQEMILEELNEMYVTDIAGSEEDRAIDRHRAMKRARGEYPRRPSIPSEYIPPSDEEVAKRSEARTKAMVDATRNILMINPGAILRVDPDTYAGIEKYAPELLDRITSTQSGGQR